MSESVSFHVAHVITELQWSGMRTRAWVQTSAPPLITCEGLGAFLNPSNLWFPHLWNGGNNTEPASQDAAWIEWDLECKNTCDCSLNVSSEKQFSKTSLKNVLKVPFLLKCPPVTLANVIAALSSEMEICRQVAYRRRSSWAQHL